MRQRLAIGLSLIVLFALTPATVAHASSGDSRSGDVIFSDGDSVTKVHKLPDGGTEYITATLARGAKAPVLASNTVLDPGGPGCSINGANAWHDLCGINRVHWAGTHPTVYFIDHTGPAWPVYEAAVQWNYSTAIDAVYRSGSSGCPWSSASCVHVSENNDPNLDCAGIFTWVGCTRVLADGNNIIYFAESIMNNLHSHGYSENQIATCHEEGHALGLGHNWYTSSCMYRYVTSPTSRYPSSADYQMLDSIY
jgi:hypothetical protein